MTWSKLSDDYSDDAWTLTDAAFRLHTEGIVWSNRKLLDCIISKDDLRRFAKTPEALQELLDAGFWQDAGTCYVIRHHAQYQRSREAVLKQQEANRENGGKGGRPKGKPREQKSNSVSEPQSHGITGVSKTAARAQDFPARINTGEKTKSVTESQSKSETKRDRPGIEDMNSPEISNVVDPWATSRMSPEEDEAWINGTPGLPPAAGPSLVCSAHPDKLVIASCAECREAYDARKSMRQVAS